MIRRTVVFTSVMVAATAVAAMAFAPDVSRMTRALNSRVQARLHGFTADPSAGIPAVDLPSDGAANGTYCPVPPKNSGRSDVPTSISSGAAGDSSAALLLEGKTEIPAGTPVGFCPGVPPSLPSRR
jgi:hypothetical protein